MHKINECHRPQLRTAWKTQRQRRRSVKLKFWMSVDVFHQERLTDGTGDGQTRKTRGSETEGKVSSSSSELKAGGYLEQREHLAVGEI